MSEKDRTEIVSLGEQGSGGGAAGGKIYKDEQPRSGDGRKGGFQRYIDLTTITNFLLTMQGTWMGVALGFQLSLPNGGPASLIYGSIFVTVGTLAVVLSMAEMASMDPVVGAQYRWSASLAPKYPKFWGLIQGWVTVFAWVAAVAANCILGANVITGLAIFNYESYEYKSWHTTLLMWAFAVGPVAWNFYFKKYLKAVEITGGVFLIVFFVVNIAVLAALAPRSTSEFVFNTLVHDVSGWTDPAMCWGMGIIILTTMLAGFDGAIHMSNEVKQPRTRVPWSMVASTCVNATMMFAFVICLMYTLGDLQKVTDTPTELPILEVYYQATRNKHATNLLVVMLELILIITQFNFMASASRLIWSFASDKGLPFSKYFAYVSPKLGVPVNAIILIGVICVLLAIIPIGSTVAFFALISLPSVAYYVSYFPPILFIMVRKLQGRHPKYGPFKLGRWGIPINLYALVYILFVLSFAALPPFKPVTGTTLNYAGPLVLGIIVLALIDWFTSGRHRFEVPVPHDIVG